MKYSDELYHFGIKGMKWGVRRNRSRGPGRRKKYNRTLDLMKRSLTNNHIGAIRTGLRARKAYKQKLKADMEWDSVRDSELERLQRSNAKYQQAKQQWTKAINERDRSDAHYHKWERAEERLMRLEEPMYRAANSKADKVTKAKYGYTSKDFQEPQYSQKAYWDKKKQQRR